MSEPEMHIAVRQREGCEMLAFDKAAKEFKQVEFSSSGVDHMVYDSAGNCLATYNRKEGVAEVFDAASLERLAVVECEKAMHIALSTKGTFLAIWRAPELEGKRENLFVYKVATKELLNQGWIPNWPCIAWSQDEATVAVRNVVHGIHIFSDISQNPLQTVPGRWTDCSLSPTSPPTIIAYSIPSEKEREDTPSKIVAFRPPKIDKFLIEHEIKIDSGKLTWNKKGTAAIFTAQLDSDKSGVSYYGEAALLLLQIQEKRVSVIPTGKTPVHDARWSCNGKEFIAIFGKMPNNEATLFDEKGNIVHKFPVGPKNTVAWSPHNRFFFLSGFGGLAGDVVVYDREKILKSSGIVGRFNMSSVVQYSFSPCSRYIMCSTVHPRMTIANRIVVFKHNGEKVCQRDYPQLWDAVWRPLPSKFFAVRDASPSTHVPDVAKPPPKAVVFRAAGSSAIAGAIKNQMSANKQTGYSTQHSASRVGDSFTSWRADDKEAKKVQAVTVPGAVAACVGADVTVEKEKKVKKDVEVPQLPVEDFKSKSYPDVEKALRAAKKKVQACGQLKNKDVKTLQPEQTQKLAGFTNAKAEAVYLEGLLKAGVTSQ